jgi:hypothetical protein
MAKMAVVKDRRSFYPLNLLGAISFERGNAEQGDAYFSEAVKLGAVPQNQDREIRGALVRAGLDARRAVIEYLIRKDPVRYGWARQYSSAVR